MIFPCKHDVFDIANVTQLATQFLDYMNPDRWDGKGDCPNSFLPFCYELTVNEEKRTWLAVYFDNDNDEKEWRTYVHAMDNNCQYGYGSSCSSINSAKDIANVIVDVFNHNEWLKTVANFYYWIDTEFYYGDFSVPKFALIRGKRNEDGSKDRESEEVICWATYEDVGGDNDDVIENYIKEKIGYIPDYEVN